MNLLNDSISEGEVHLYFVPLDVPCVQQEALQALLIDQEVTRYTRIRPSLQRSRAMVARAMLRKLLGQYLGIAPNAVAVYYGPQGKPNLGPGFALEFNLSHSGGLAGYIFSLKRKVGIDIEEVRVAQYYLSVAGHRRLSGNVGGERQRQRHQSQGQAPGKRCLRQLKDKAEDEAEDRPEDEVKQGNKSDGLKESREVQAKDFLTVWTRKEAWLKAVGVGLYRPMSSFQVSDPEDPPRLLALKEGREEIDHWWMQSITPAPGYVGTIVREGEPKEVLLKVL